MFKSGRKGSREAVLNLKMRKMKIIQTFFVLIIFFSIVGCLAANNNLVPVKDYSKPISALGFPGVSILPPQDKDWFIINNGQGGNFAKKTSDPNHTAVCHFLVVPLEEEIKNPDQFLEWVKISQKKDSGPDRFKDQEYNYNLNKRFSPICVEYKIKAIDSQMKAKNGNSLIFKAYGYIFIPVRYPKYAFSISYSERGVERDFTTEVKEIGDKFIDNLIIEK